jgi:ATP-dependent DNA helicase RecG
MIEIVKKILKQKEGVRLEFKEAKTELPSNLFESICSMLNRDGGDIFLGVNNAGKIIGVDSTKLETLKTNIVNLSNNAQKLDPPFILFPLVYEINGKTIIHLQIPESSQVHKTNNTVFDRSNDGDFKVV